MKILIAMLLLIMSGVVSATTLSWEPPTSRVDDHPLDPLTELSHYNLYCGVVDDSTPFQIPAGTEQGSYEVEKTKIFPGYGQYKCTLTAVDNDGLESVKSEEVVIPWDPAVPNSPTNLLIIQ